MVPPLAGFRGRTPQAHQGQQLVSRAGGVCLTEGRGRREPNKQGGGESLRQQPFRSWSEELQLWRKLCRSCSWRCLGTAKAPFGKATPVEKDTAAGPGPPGSPQSACRTAGARRKRPYRPPALPRRLLSRSLRRWLTALGRMRDRCPVHRGRVAGHLRMRRLNLRPAAGKLMSMSAWGRQLVSLTSGRRGLGGRGRGSAVPQPRRPGDPARRSAERGSRKCRRQARMCRKARMACPAGRIQGGGRA